MTTAAADRTDSSTNVSGKQDAKTSDNISGAMGITADANQAQHRFPLGRWTSVFRNPFTKSSPPATPVRTPVQSELLLDLVKPVRNDLTDSDLVVVPSRPAVGAKAQSTASTASTQPAQPAQLTGPAVGSVEGPRPALKARVESGGSVESVESVEPGEPVSSAQPVWSRLKTQFFGVEKG